MCRNAAAFNWRPCLRARSRARCVQEGHGGPWAGASERQGQARPGQKGPAPCCMACTALHPGTCSGSTACAQQCSSRAGCGWRCTWLKAEEARCKAMSVRQQLGVVGGGSPSCARKQRLELGHGTTDRQDKTRSSLQISHHPCGRRLLRFPGIANQTMPHRVLTVEPTRWVTNPIVFWGCPREDMGDGDKDSNSQQPAPALVVDPGEPRCQVTVPADI